MKEGNIGKLILLAASKFGARIWRNNVAKAAVGEIDWIRKEDVAREPRTVNVTIRAGEKLVRVREGDAVVRKARLLHAGLAPGSADYIGFTPVVITPEMVGKTLPVFTSVEAKTETGRVQADQVAWLDFMLRSGAVAGVARSPEDAVAILQRGPSV